MTFLRLVSIFGCSLSAWCLGPVVGGAAAAEHLVVVLTDVAHKNGSLRIALYNDPEGFRDEAKALVLRDLVPQIGSISTTFSDLPEGTYGVIAYHDENGNGEMDRFLGMIPTEGFGLSNNPEISGPPQFDECAYRLEAGQSGRVEITLRY